VIRISVTDLDSYLYWKSSEDMEFESLLKRLRGEEPPTQPMMAGRAFHTVFENADVGDLDRVTQDGFEFVFALDHDIALPPIRELKGEVVLDTPSGPVTLVGKVDSLDGITVHDYKLTERFDAERYADSYQWRAYLSMFWAKRFVYDVFQGRYDGNRITVYAYERLSFSAYPSMRRDVEMAVAGLAEIIAKHVPQKIMSEAA
jgi:hypothetical protein